MRKLACRLVLVAALSGAPAPLLACPACLGQGIPGRAIRTYLGITLLLSVLPLVAGTTLWWLVRPRREAPGPPSGPPERHGLGP